MNKITILDAGKDPQLLTYKYMQNARTKVKLSLGVQSKLKIGEKAMIGDMPIISLYLDSLVLNVKDDIATKLRSFYKIEVEDVPWLSIADLNELRKELNDIVKVTNTSKLDCFGNTLESTMNNLSDQNETVKDLVNSVNQIFDAPYLTFPSEPVGPGAVWVFENKNSMSLTNIGYETVGLVNLVKVHGHNVDLDVLSRINSTDEQMQKAADEESTVLKFKGASKSEYTIDIGTAEREGKYDGVMEVITKMINGKDSGKIIDSNQKIALDLEYIY